MVPAKAEQGGGLCSSGWGGRARDINGCSASEGLSGGGWLHAFIIHEDSPWQFTLTKLK